MASWALSAVAQSRGDAIDREMDRALGALISITGAVTAQQLDLQVVERVEIGKTVSYRARERGVSRKKISRLCDREQPAAREFPLFAQALPHAFAHHRIGDELGIARSDAQIGLGEDHVHVGKHAAKEWPILRHLTQFFERVDS